MTAREVVDSLASFAAGWVAVGGPVVLIGPFAGSVWMARPGTAAMKLLLAFLAGAGFAWAYDRQQTRRLMAVLDRGVLDDPYLGNARWHDSGEAVETRTWTGTYPSPNVVTFGSRN